jgi:hypothetical protein
MAPADPVARGAASEVVAEVLKVTPRSHDGSVTVEYAKPCCGYDACTEHNDIDGPAEPIAARQAAAVLRWLAEYRRVNGGYPAWTPGELDELADEIDGGTDGQ